MGSELVHNNSTLPTAPQTGLVVIHSGQFLLASSLHKAGKTSTSIGNNTNYRTHK